MSFISPPLCRTSKHLRSEPLGPQPDGAHLMPEIAHNWISPVRIKVNASRIAVATASAAQSEDRSANQKTTFFDSIGQTETNDHVSGTSALDRTPEESANCRPGGLAPGAGISVPEKRPFIPLSATMLFFLLFLLGRSRNLHERGGGLRDLRLLLFRLLGFTVTTNLTFRHRNSPLKRLAGCGHSLTPGGGT